MMKRLLAALFGVALFTTMTAAAYADGPFSQPVKFKYARAFGSQLVTLDSTYVMIPASFAGISLVDTSESIDTRQWSYHGPYGQNWLQSAKGYVITDTMTAFTLLFRSTTGAAVTGMDTLGVTPQYSADGFVWASVDTLGPGLTATLFPLVSLASSASSVYTFNTTMGGIGAKRLNWDRPLANFIRFIVRKDPNSTAGSGYELLIMGRKN